MTHGYCAAGDASGPVIGREPALRAAVRHHCQHERGIRAEDEALAAAVMRLQERVVALRAQLDQADTGAGLEPWRRALSA